MSDGISPFDEFDMGELSKEDLAILQAFEAMDTWQSQCQTDDRGQTLAVSPTLPQVADEEMLLMFTAEAEGDISSMRRVLNQLAQHEPENLALFMTLKRAGHKLHGTAGAIGFPLISTVAAQIELLAEGVSHGAISAHAGAEAISAATTVLEACLPVVPSACREGEATSSLAGLEAVYQSLHIDLQRLKQEQAAASSPMYIEAQRLKPLVMCIEKLVEQRTTVEDALAQVACALQELHLAQTRLQHLELPIAKLCKSHHEQDALQFALKDAIADLAITTANVQAAFAHNSMMQQEYLVNVAQLYKDTLLHLPYGHSSVCCLLVLVGDQHLLIPFHQIQRISNEQREQIDVCYSLQELLAFPGVSPESTSRHLPLLILSSGDAVIGGRTAGIVVDEILGEQECVVKPLAFYLQRPGIAGATIDGKGCVLLVVDLLALIRAAPQCANYSDTSPSLWLGGVSE